LSFLYKLDFNGKTVLTLNKYLFICLYTYKKKHYFPKKINPFYPKCNFNGMIKILIFIAMSYSIIVKQCCQHQNTRLDNSHEFVKTNVLVTSIFN